MNIDEKEYDKWKASLGTYDKTDSFLLLPRSHTFSRSGFCGNAGTATVPLTPPRSTTTATPTSYPRKSTTR